MNKKNKSVDLFFLFIIFDIMKLVINMYYIFLFILSVLPVIILGKYVYNKDRNKEPKKVLTKLFLFGICSVIITLLLTNVLEIFFPFLKLEM